MTATELAWKLIREGVLRANESGIVELKNKKLGWIKPKEHLKNGYRRVAICRYGHHFQISCHRVVWMFFNNQPIPDGLQNDHINRDKLDNRPRNLGDYPIATRNVM